MVFKVDQNNMEFVIIKGHIIEQGSSDKNICLQYDAVACKNGLVSSQRNAPGGSQTAYPT